MSQETAPQEATRSPGGFIPFRRSDLVDMLGEDERLASSERDAFRAFARLLGATFHFEFRDRLEALKDTYAPFARDPDTRTVHSWSEGEREEALDRLVAELRGLLEDANFRPVADEELERALEEESLVKLRVEVDFDDFEHLLFFRRGETRREEEVSSWYGLRKRTVTFTNLEKVVMLVTFKGADHFAGRDEDLEDLSFEPGSTVIKLFQDVPRADLEMLFPNARVRMRLVDKLLIGVPALVSGIIVLATKLLANPGPAVRAGERLARSARGTGGPRPGRPGHPGRRTRRARRLPGPPVQQVQEAQARVHEHARAQPLLPQPRQRPGGLHHLLDAAEEEEVKEALLGWFFLHTADRPLDRGELDGAVEHWLAQRWDSRLDFEVDDGLAKLGRLGLVEEEDGGRLNAVPLDDALRRLDERWDSFFEYDGAGSG